MCLAERYKRESEPVSYTHLDVYKRQVRDVLAMLHRITGRRRVRVMLPLWLARAAAPLSEQYYRLLRLSLIHI